MIWFNLKEIERKIIQNELSDKETFNYFLWFSIMNVFGISSINHQDFLSLTELLITFAITIWGTYTIFNVNNSGDGHDFFKRFFPLAWVVAFRIFIFTIIAIIPITFILYILILPHSITHLESDQTSPTEEWIFLILSFIVLIIYYLQLKKSFKRVSSRQIV